MRKIEAINHQRHLATEHFRDLTRQILRLYHLRVEGQEHLGDGSPKILAIAPHTGQPDGPLVRAALPKGLRRRFKFAHAHGYFSSLARTTAKQAFADTFSVHRNTSNGQREQDQQVASDLLESGYTLAYFLEGGRKDPNIDIANRNFRHGVASLWLATKGQYPIVPTLIIGAEHLWPKGQHIPSRVLWPKHTITDHTPLRPQVTVTFGTPLHPALETDTDTTSGKFKPITDQIHQALIEMENNNNPLS